MPQGGARRNDGADVSRAMAAASGDTAIIAALATLEGKVEALGKPRTDPTVIASLAGVETKLNIFVDEFREHRRNTETYRKDNMLVVTSLNTSVQGLGANVAAMNDKIEKITPIVANHANRFAEQAGGIKLGKIVWMAIGGSGLGLLGFVAAKIFH